MNSVSFKMRYSYGSIYRTLESTTADKLAGELLHHENCPVMVQNNVLAGKYIDAPDTVLGAAKSDLFG